MSNWKQIAGIADGVLVAALTALGTLYPPVAAYVGVAVMVLGALGTTLGVAHAVRAAS